VRRERSGPHGDGVSVCVRRLADHAPAQQLQNMTARSTASTAIGQLAQSVPDPPNSHATKQDSERKSKTKKLAQSDRHRKAIKSPPHIIIY
jgi:hypothetical protein